MSEDYRIVLPLPLKRTIGPLRQARRAPFTQQGGPYGTLPPEGLEALLSVIPSTVVSCRLPLSARFAQHSIPPGFKKTVRTNLVVDLTPAYPELIRQCGKTLRKKLRRYPADQLTPASPEEVVGVYRERSGQKAGLSPAHYRQIRRLMEESKLRDNGHCYRLEADGTVLAAGFFPIVGGRVINLFAGSTAVGLKRDGMARLLAGVMKIHRGPGHLFDFEGSEIPGVAAFFRSFGARESLYPMVSKKGFFF